MSGELVGILLFLLVAAGVLIIPVAGLVAAIIALTRLGTLQRRVAELEAGRTPPVPAWSPETARAESAAANAAAAQVPPTAAARAAAASAPARAAAPRESLEMRLGSGCTAGAAHAQPHPAPESWEMRLGSGCAARLGALAIIIGIGFFFQYAFEHDWLGPAARVLTGILFGSVFLAWGEWLRTRQYGRTAMAVTGAGLATYYFSAYAAHAYYHLIAQVPAYGFLILLTLLAVGLAVRHDSRVVAALGLLGGMLTPLLLSTGANSLPGLALYLLLLDAGFLLLTQYRAWPWLNCLAWLGTVVLLGGWVDAHYTREQFNLALAAFTGFALLFAELAVWRQLVRQERIGWWELLLLLVNAAAYYAAGAAMVDDWNPLWTGAFTLAVAAAALVFALLAQRRLGSDRKLVTVSAGLALTFLSLVFPMQFDGAAVTLAWIVEGALLVALGTRLPLWPLRFGGWLLLAVATGRLLEYGRVETVLLNERFALWLLLLAALYTVLALYRRRAVRLPQFEARAVRVVVVSAAQLLVLVALGAENDDYFRHGQQGDEPGRQAQEEQLRRRQWELRDELREANLSAGSYDARQAALAGVERDLERLAAERQAAEAAAERQQRQDRNAEQMNYSLIMGGYAVLLLIAGLLTRSALARRLAIGLFALTVLKVFFVDLAGLESLYRIISFIVLGFLLLGVSLLYTRCRAQIDAFMRGGEEHDA